MQITERYIPNIKEAQTRMLQSGLIIVVKDLAKKVPGWNVGIKSGFYERGAFSWPSVTIDLPQVTGVDRTGHLSLVFASMQFNDHYPEIGLHGWIHTNMDDGTPTSSRISPSLFEPEFTLPFPTEPAFETLQNITVPRLLRDFTQVFAKE